MFYFRFSACCRLHKSDVSILVFVATEDGRTRSTREEKRIESNEINHLCWISSFAFVPQHARHPWKMNLRSICNVQTQKYKYDGLCHEIDIIVDLLVSSSTVHFGLCDSACVIFQLLNFRLLPF